jgi:hypothetical protein
MLPESAEPLGEGLADTLGEAPGVSPDPARGTPARLAPYGVRFVS